MGIGAVTQAQLEQDRTAVVKLLVDLQGYAADNDQWRSRVDEATQELTGRMKELRQAATIADHHSVAPTGTEREAYVRYAMPAAQVASQALEVSERGGVMSYGNYDVAERGAAFSAGKEYAVSKKSDTAVRLLSEWDIMGNRYPGYLDDPEPVTQHQIVAQQLFAARGMARILRARPGHGGAVQYGSTHQIDAAIARHMARGPEYVRQVFADNAGEGGEFVPDVVLPGLERKLELPRSVVALFQTQNVPTGGTTTNPFLTTGCQPFIVGVPTSGDLDPADIQRSVPTTSSINMSPKTWGISLPANRDAMEDSIVEWGAFGQMLLAEGARDGMEDALINADLNGGDTGLTGWNIRSRWNTLGSTNDHRKSFVGLRHRAIDQSATADITANQTTAGLMSQLILMSSPDFLDNIAYITSPEFMVAKLMQDTNLLTVDKMGNLATLLTGQVGSIGGRPLVLSEFVDTQYNASGVYDDSTKTKTGVIIVSRNRWAVAYRRGPRIEVETRPTQHTSYLVLSVRWTFRNLGASTEKSEAWLYNADPS